MRTLAPYRSSILLKISCLSISFVFISMFSSGQAAWNQSTLAFSRSTAALENMSGATTIEVDNSSTGGIWNSTALSFGGFNFRYGLKSYNTFYVSPYGFLKLGNPITSNNPTADTTIIAPFYDYSLAFYSLSYKTIGSPNNRKTIIHFEGNTQPTGYAKFQVWLFERTGKIQFVYDHIEGFYYDYSVFLNNNIFNKLEVASVKVPALNGYPFIHYAFIFTNSDSIATNTCYTFQPDTVKPATPAVPVFSNIQATCFDISITENSNNESVVAFEGAINGGPYKPEKYLYISSPQGSSVQNYNQQNMQVFTDYSYRVFTSNGFLNSDTVSATAKTSMPMINGIIKVPGDYPSITAIFQDAPCKQLGPDLIIELQSNYNFASETKPIYFNKKLQNSFIRSITIRPAAGANIELAANSKSIFLIDSVHNVIIDGRAGGVGTNRNLTIRKQNPNSVAIFYRNAADSGKVLFCNIIDGYVFTSSLDTNFSKPGKEVNSFTMANCNLTASSGVVNYLFRATGSDSTGNSNFLIDNNLFSMFNRDALTITNGGQNTVISNNRFYQPAPFSAQTFLPDPTATCIKLMNTEFVTVDGNLMGGSVPEWGKGKYQVTVSPGDDYNFIHYQNSSMAKKAMIKNNRFGNIHSTGTTSFTKMIYANGGEVTIANNYIGTADSLASITHAGIFWGIELWYGKKYVLNNFFSGLHGQYPNITNNSMNYFATNSFVDSAYYYGNDFGGSNDPNANTGWGTVAGIYGGVSRVIYINKNEFRGMNSKKYDTYAIDFDNGQTNASEQLLADSNTIHHLAANVSAHAIWGSINAGDDRTSRISYNHIYSLYSRGLSVPNPSSYGSIRGISFSLYNWDGVKRGTLDIFGNRIHALEPTPVSYPNTNSFFTIDGIGGSAPNCHIWNNDIQLGITASGRNIDTLNTIINGISGGGALDQLVAHNSVYIGGRGPGCTGIGQTRGAYNNIIQIDRVNTDPSSPHKFQYPFSQASQSIINGKNIWYSATEPANTANLLATFKSNCKCDTTSFIGNPSFINPKGDSATYDLRILTGSKADSAGIILNAGIYTDIDGLYRDAYTPVDIGSHVATMGTIYGITWTGAVSSAWENPNNWNPAKLPGVLSDVTIAAGLINYPVVNSNAFCRSLAVSPQASFIVTQGYTLTIVH